MELLRDLTVVLGAVLVVTVVGGLVMVAIFLQRISGALGDARVAMDEMVDRAAPLEAHLVRLRDASGEWAEQLGVARRPLARADRMVAASSERRQRASDASGSRTNSPRRWKWVSRLFGG